MKHIVIKKEKKKMENKDCKIKDYENNISEDIVYSDDTLNSSWVKISNKLEKKRPFFLVVLDKNEKILGVITIRELRKMVEQSKLSNSMSIAFGSYIIKHRILEESEVKEKSEKELKKPENLNFILVKNKNGNYVGKKYSI
jgi:CBS-domain-containing membrane protein